MIFIKHLICVVSLFPAAIILAEKTLNIPDVYIVEGNANNVLEGFEFSFKGWYDKKARTSRFDYNGGEVETYQLPGGSFKIVPTHSNLDKDFTSMTCFKKPSVTLIQSALPDVSRFVFVKTETINEKSVNRFERETDNVPETVKMKETLWTLADSTNYTIPFRYENRQYNYADNKTEDNFIYLLQHFYLEYLYFEKKDCINPKTFVVDKRFDKICTQIDAEDILNPLKSFIPKPKTKYGKKNSLNRNSYRRNLALINSVNRAGLGYKLEANQFVHKTPEELRAMFDHSPLLDHEPMPVDAIEAIPDGYLPNELDWRERGQVTPVRSQGGSCQASGYFAVVGAVEGAYFLNNSTLLRLSAKVVMDCSWKDNGNSANYGCYSNSPAKSFEWIMKTGGLPHEGAYRTYSPIEGNCETEPLSDPKLLIPIYNYTKVVQNVTLLKKALFEYGPLAVRIKVPMSKFLFYSHGIFNCDATAATAAPDPTVPVYSLLVGYGIFQGMPYWLLKMSYGFYWGENGYIMINADPAKDSCGILEDAYYVIIKNATMDAAIY